MLRYEGQIAKIYEELSPLGKGLIFIETPPGEEEAVFAAMPADLVGERRSLEDVAAGRGHVRAMTIVGLAGPPDRAARDKVLYALDQWRERFSLGGVRLIVLTDFDGMQAVERHAGSMFSARSHDAIVEFEPDPTVTYEEARKSLNKHLQETFGRFNLRGLVRSEGEDVAFRFEDLFQQLWVSPSGFASVENLERLTAADSAVAEVKTPEKGPETETNDSPRRSLAGSLLRSNGAGIKLRIDSLQGYFDYRNDPESWRGPLVILGGPGSGKTSLLRWMALRASREASFLGVEAPIPVLLSLPEFAASPLRRKLLLHLRQRLLEQRQPAGHLLDRAIRDGRAIFLFDGLDEVSEERARKRIRDELRELSNEAKDCLLVVTSRITGYEQPFAKADEVMIQPLDEEAIRAFLTSWCTLYAQERVGATEAAREEGRREGERLSEAVFANPSVRALAENPLLLTVLAIVHRAGIKLPDHRVELYDHITRILVERWNRARTMETGREETPVLLKSSDAVRLLGPLSLRAIERGDAGSMPLSLVRGEIAKVLKSGAVRGFESADQVIQLFRDTLGVLVETGVDQFAFLHLTLGEYFAAWELVRSSRLEKIAADPEKAFAPVYREVLLLAAGILGVIRADDERLGRIIDSLVGCANDFKERNSSGVERLLAELLADDPFLTADQGEKIVHTLVPRYWFGTPSTGWRFESLPLPRLREGRHMSAIADALEKTYRKKGIPAISDAHLIESMICLEELNLDSSMAFIPLLELRIQKNGRAKQPLPTPLKLTMDVHSSLIRLAFRVSKDLDHYIRHKGRPIFLEFTTFAEPRVVAKVRTPWPEIAAAGEDESSRLFTFNLVLNADIQAPPESIAVTAAIDIPPQEAASSAP